MNIFFKKLFQINDKLKNPVFFFQFIVALQAILVVYEIYKLLVNTNEDLTVIVSAVFSFCISIYCAVYVFTQWTKFIKSKKFGLFFGLLNISNFIVCFAQIYCYFGLKEVATGLIVHDGFLSLYFSIITVTTVGYGDVAPATNTCRTFVCIEALFGYFMLAISAGAIPLFLASTNKK